MYLFHKDLHKMQRITRNLIHNLQRSSLVHRPFLPQRRYQVLTTGSPGPSPYNYTGTLRYPLDALLTVARSILKAQKDHYGALRKAADDANDEDEELEQSYNFMDVNACVWRLDQKKSKADVEKNVPGVEWEPHELEYFEDPRGSEKGLFRLSRFEWVNSKYIFYYYYCLPCLNFILRLSMMAYSVARIRVVIHHPMIMRGARKMHYLIYCSSLENMMAYLHYQRIHPRLLTDIFVLLVV